MPRKLISTFLNHSAQKRRGGSIITVKGQCTKAVVKTSGAGKIKAYDLNSEEVDAKLSGSSIIEVSVVRYLAANTTGASKLLYKGSPEISRIHASKASSISKKD
ncbi:MAG: DUF2807 domain-containing protein [Rikenellaceae bacterium]|nr:DUF2807 domain-containing protein [Rikenellaceae bacterium]